MQENFGSDYNLVSQITDNLCVLMGEWALLGIRRTNVLQHRKNF